MPMSIARYIRGLGLEARLFAYIGLDSENIVSHVGGALAQFGLSSVELGQPANAQLDYLEGLLPGDANPIVIQNTQFLGERFVDLHLFCESDEQWVLYVDNTEAGIDTQATQQKRLDKDILQEAQNR